MTTPPSQGFEKIEGLEVTPEMSKAFAQDGISTPTAVQSAVISPILEGKNVVIHSGTGTGKTLSYLLPILQKLRLNKGSRAVCLAPAAELALQTLRVADRYKAPSLNSTSLVSGGNQRQQQSRLQKSTQLIVGTPGRILEMFAQRKLKGVTTMVLDEAEPILGGKDADYLREILSRPDPKVQLIFAAATFGSRAERWIAERMGPDVVRPQISDDPLKSRIEHSTVRVANETHRDQELVRFIEKNNCKRAIVFVNQPNLLRHLYRFLDDQRLKPVSVSRDRSKQQNRQALMDFERSAAQVLLTTDGAATGLDIADVSWVIHYEMPSSPEAYVHRAGRTGRAGRDGQSVVLLADNQKARLSKMAKDLGVEFSERER